MAIVLDTTSKSVVLELVETVTNQPEYTVAYSEHTTGLFTEAGTDGTLADASETTIVSAPSASVKRIIKNITVYNPDTSTVTINLKLVNGANKRMIEKTTIPYLGTWKFTGDAAVAGPIGPIGVPGPANPAVNLYLTYVIPGASPQV